MIYRRPIRDVVEERHGRVCGVHLFVVYAVALAAVLGMSSACLFATRSGYFKYSAENAREDLEYEITYGWRLMCSRVSVATENDYGCFGLDKTEPLQLEVANDTEEPWTAGSSMTADTGLAVALGHVVVVLIALIHLLFFLLLLGKIEPMPVRGYLYMRGLGLMSALASFYLIFTCVVSFFFGVKDSLDSEMENSAGLRPSWAYIVTVVDVGLLMMVAIKACQDDEVDSAIATPQYTSSSRDEDTVKRASGKLLHLRSKSSDTILEGSITNVPTSAPKATVGDSGMSGVHLAPTARVALVRDPRIVGPTLPTSSFTGSSSAAASAAAAAAAAAAASVSAVAAASTEAAASPVPSSSVRSSWTEKVSGFSPVRHRGEVYGGIDGDGNVDGPEEKDGKERDIEGGMLVDWMLDGARRDAGVAEDHADAFGQEQQQQCYRRDEDSLEDDVGGACAGHDACGDDVEEGGNADQREGHLGGAGTEEVGVMGGLEGKGSLEEEGEDESEKENEVQGSRFHRTSSEVVYGRPGEEHEAIYRPVSVVRSSLAEFSTAKTAFSVGFDDPEAVGRGGQEGDGVFSSASPRDDV